MLMNEISHRSVLRNLQDRRGDMSFIGIDAGTHRINEQLLKNARLYINIGDT